MYVQCVQTSERKARRKKINGLAFCWWCTPCQRPRRWQRRGGLLLNSFLYILCCCLLLSSSYFMYRFGRWELIEKAWFFHEKKGPNELVLFHAPRMTSIAVAVATPCWRAEIEPSTENNFILFYFKFLLFSSPLLYDSDVGRVMTYTLENLKRKKKSHHVFFLFSKEICACVPCTAAAEMMHDFLSVVSELVSVQLSARRTCFLFFIFFYFDLL